MTSVKVSKYLSTYLACNCNLPNQICIFSNFEASILEVVELIQARGGGRGQADQMRIWLCNCPKMPLCLMDLWFRVKCC